MNLHSDTVTDTKKENCSALSSQTVKSCAGMLLVNMNRAWFAGQEFSRGARQNTQESGSCLSDQADRFGEYRGQGMNRYSITTAPVVCSEQQSEF